MLVRLVIRRLRVRPPPGRQDSFVEIDHEIFSTVILSLPLIQELTALDMVVTNRLNINSDLLINMSGNSIFLALEPVRNINLSSAELAQGERKKLKR